MVRLFIQTEGDILGWNKSEGDLPHYYYIFRNLVPLGTYMKNVACSRLVNMIGLDTQKGEETMKTLVFQKYIRGNAACMKRLIMDKKGCVQLK